MVQLHFANNFRQGRYMVVENVGHRYFDTFDRVFITIQQQLKHSQSCKNILNVKRKKVEL